MTNFKREYFDKIAFNMREFAEHDFIAVHVWKIYKNCRVVRIPIEVLEDGNMWDYIYQEAIKKWDEINNDKELCPHCHNPRKNWERMNLGRHFCGFCGEALSKRNATRLEPKKPKPRGKDCTKVDK